MALKCLSMALVIASCGVGTIQSQIVVPHTRTQRSDTTLITVYADGNVRSLMTGGDKESTGGTGAIRGALSWKNAYLSAQLNIATTVDTLTSKVGATMFPPTYAKALNSVLIDTRLWFGKTDGGIHAYGGFSLTPWGVKAATGYADSAQALVWELGAGYFYDLGSPQLSDSLGNNTFSITLELGAALRDLTGDVTNGSHGVIQDQVFGTRKTFFVGPTVGVEIRSNNVILALQVYDFPQTKGIDGFSGFQVAAGVGVQGSVLNIIKVRPRRRQ